MSTFDEFVRNDSARRLLEEESLILQGTELIVRLLEDQHVTRAELAKRIGKTPSYVTQMLSGGRNMTLRTLAASCAALGTRIHLETVSWESAAKDSRHVYQFTGVLPRRCDESLNIQGSVPPHAAPAPQEIRMVA